VSLIEIELKVIVDSVAKFDESSEVYLFGSRVDDCKKGGYIDSLLKSHVLNKETLSLVEDELFKHIEAQQVDIVLTGKSTLTSFAAMVLDKEPFGYVKRRTEVS
jgi:hypothetical protein